MSQIKHLHNSIVSTNYCTVIKNINFFIWWLIFFKVSDHLCRTDQISIVYYSQRFLSKDEKIVIILFHILNTT